jgi:hypothetical protein
MDNSINPVRPRSLPDLPPEILDMILPQLRVHDLTTYCIRVNKAWYCQFIDRIWHTINLSELSDYYPASLGKTTNQPKRNSWARFAHSYGSPKQDVTTSAFYAASTTTDVATPDMDPRYRPSLARNLHRIRILKVQRHYEYFLTIFGQAILQSQTERLITDPEAPTRVELPNLEELYVQFYD